MSDMRINQSGGTQRPHDTGTMKKGAKGVTSFMGVQQVHRSEYEDKLGKVSEKLKDGKPVKQDTGFNPGVTHTLIGKFSDQRLAGI